MEEPLIEKVRVLKAQALGFREENPEEALRVLGIAESDLRAALLELSAKRATEPPGDYEKRIASQLVHVLGSMGGVCRRHHDDKRSIDFYDDGYQIEKEYHLADSYALVQRLVARVLDDPGILEAQESLINGSSMNAALHDAEAVVQQQIDDRLRDRDEYASADLAVVRLLLGEGDWADRLKKLKDQGSSYAVNVTHDTLKEVLAAVKRSPRIYPQLRKDLEAALRMLPKRK